VPYSSSDIISVYHVRSFEVFQLFQVAHDRETAACISPNATQLTGKVDVLLTHDWPQQISHYGDSEALFRRKSFLRAEVEYLLIVMIHICVCVPIATRVVRYR
jgi:lariat debranching enzyme